MKTGEYTNLNLPIVPIDVQEFTFDFWLMLTEGQTAGDIFNFILGDFEVKLSETALNSNFILGLCDSGTCSTVNLPFTRTDLLTNGSRMWYKVRFDLS